MSSPLQEHWNKKYTDTPITQLGWYEAVSQPSVELVEKCAVPRQSANRQTYHSLLQKVVMPGGFVVIAAFAITGAMRCSGLPVQRYSPERLNDFMGDGFRPLENIDYLYQTPSGDLRPYVYARFQKVQMDRSERKL